MSLAVWIIIFVLLCAFAFYAARMLRASDEDEKHDTGQAILDFARAFPMEAIRSLHMTADSSAVFVRLHGNKAGFMKNMGTHFACMLIHPGSLRIEQLPDNRSFRAEFVNASKFSGEFRFATPAEAAEVTLWLLDSYLEEGEANTTGDGPADPAPAS